MNIIRITAAELLPGDDNDGEIIATVDVQGAKTYITYEGDESRLRTASTQVYTVRREGGVSTVKVERSNTPVQEEDRLTAEALAAQERERVLLNSLRRERRQFS